MTFLSFADVSMTYEGSDRPIRALDAFSLEVGRGEPVSVIGPSGCGKSTMLLLAAGVLAPTAGRVTIDGAESTGPRRATALILQDHGLLPWKTVEDNVALGLVVRRETRRTARAQAREALARVGLAEFARSYPGELSGGMRQRVGLARAIALDADLLLMDEPLSALYALHREDLQDDLLELWQRRGHAQVLVTHSIEEAVFLGRRIVVMTRRPGRVGSVVENPGMGSADYRQAPAFYERCAHVRTLLAAEGALHTGEDALPAEGGPAGDQAGASAEAASVSATSGEAGAS